MDLAPSYALAPLRSMLAYTRWMQKSSQKKRPPPQEQGNGGQHAGDLTADRR